MTIEREPDFEDDNIRLWRTPKDQGERPDDDETTMAVDLKREELYESRVYPLLPHPATVALVAAWLARQEAPPDQEEFLATVLAAIGESTLRVLTKRRRDDGRITYLVVAVGPTVRTLVERGEAADETDYRRLVAVLEDELLSPGLIGDPKVTTTEDWQRYELAEA